MNRRILIQVTAPAVLIGLLLFGTCLASAWWIHHLQTSLTQVLSQNVRSLEAAQELEIQVRRLRFHAFRYLLKPQSTRLQEMQHDHEQFEMELEKVKKTVFSPEEDACVAAIAAAYQKYHIEMDQLQAEIAHGVPSRDIGELVDAHPVQEVVARCQDLLRVAKDAIERTSEESSRVGSQGRLTMLLLGLGGPLSGVIVGYGVARGLSRSIYQLSVRVQDMAHRLDQDVASVSVAADGDLQHLDQQLQHVVHRVEEVAQRLQRHQREMLRAEQLSAVGQLAASVAHEVRNPLTAVKMLVDAMLRPHNRKALTLADLRVIHDEVVRVERRVQGLLDFARPPAPQRNRCDLRAVITQASDLVRARARHQGVHIAVECPEQPVVGHFDHGQLSTVLVNLFLNSLDAMPQGGSLEVSLESFPDAEARLTIRDTGSGFAPEIAGRLFVPFASTKPTGTGLGLSISRRIIEDHGGQLTAANRSEGGAEFTIHLPLESREAVHAHPVGH
jgi:signal transduction histidine kinase